MVASSLAVAGIEPVEPAAITGALAGGETLGFGLDQRSRARPARWRFFPSEISRQSVDARICKKFQRLLPILRRGRRHQFVEIFPRHLARRSCRPSGARDRRRARCAAAGVLATSAAPPSRACRCDGGPFSDESGERDICGRKRAERVVQSQRRLGRFATRLPLRESDLVFIHMAERRRCAAEWRHRLEFVEEYLAGEAAGAPGRQKERGLAQLERIVASPENRGTSLRRRAARGPAPAETAPRRGC